VRKLLLFFSLFFLSLGYSQKYNFKNYTVEDGLAQSQINDINQDNKGYLWVGTESGLSRFDGQNFVNFSIDNGLPDNKVEKIYFHKDECWVATPNGLAKLEDNRFVPYYFEEAERVNDLCYFKENLYIATNSGLMMFNGNTYEKFPFEGENELIIRSIRNFNDQFLFCGTRTGLYKWNGSYDIFREEMLDFNISDLELFEDRLIISTYGDGLMTFDFKSSKLKEIAIETSRIRSIYADEDVILCSSIRGGIELLEDRTTYFTKANGLVNESLVCMFKDAENNIWIGTDGNGLLKFLGKSVTSFSVNDGLTSNIVMSIHNELDSSFLLGTYNEGITVIREGKFSSITEEDGLKDNTVWEIKNRPNGGTWIATSNGVNLLQDGRIIVHSETEGISSKIRAIENSTAVTYFGGTDGVYEFNGSDYKRIPGTEDFNVNDLLMEDDKLYIASRTGFFSLDLANNSYAIRQIVLQEDNINSLLVDDRGMMWIGTMNGLFVRLKSGAIVPFILDEIDFNSKTTLGLLQSSSGDIWISTMSGVYQISPLEAEGYRYHLSHYATAQGLINLESNLNAIHEDAENNIWVGTASGLARIDPTFYEELFSFEAPKLHITDMRLFMEEFDYSRFDSEFANGNGVPSSISLPYNQNHITIDFIGINLKDPSSVKYEYRLIGSNSSWSPLSKTNYATYSDLAPGEYDFEVRATNKRYIWSDTETIHITIRSPFWKTWWFVLLMISTAFVIVLAIFRARIRTIKQKQENEKLSYKNRLLFLEQQSLNASMNRHFIFNSLNSIQYFINSSNKISANKYLSSFAKLIRKNLDSSTANNFIVTLQEEIERIELYLTLEKMRFQEKFDYELKISSSLDTESIEIPSMILQPFVENSIIHGVLPLERKGHIQINIFEEFGEVIFEVVDDGVGIDNTLQSKKENISGDHESKGMEITNRRIELLRKLTGDNLLIIGPFQLNDTHGNSIGTKVVIKMGVNIEQ
jgi:ligand-binding sensor domain-containing protein